MTKGLKVSDELYDYRCAQLTKLLVMNAPACIVRMAAKSVMHSVEGIGWWYEVQCWYVARAPKWMLLCWPSTRKIIRDLDEAESEIDCPE